MPAQPTSKMASHPLALPPTLSPDALDTLTEMSTILARLRTAIQTSSSNTGIAGATPAGTGATPNPLGASPSALTLKDVPTATDSLKHKLQRARTQIRALPDMSRTVKEQEAEIQELEAKLKLQREVLDRLRESGERFGAEEGGRGEKMEI
jgi:hypothetical protein